MAPICRLKNRTSRSPPRPLHRWLTHDEIVPDTTASRSSAGGSVATGGMLALDKDPKLAWAISHREQFPVDVNTAAREMLLRVPGLGVKAVTRILQARRVRKLRADDLLRLHVPLKKVMPFVVLADHQPGASLDAVNLAARLSSGHAASPAQAGLFDEPMPTQATRPVPVQPPPVAIRRLAAPVAAAPERSPAWA